MPKNRVIKKIRFNPVLFDLPAVKGYKMQLSKWLSGIKNSTTLILIAIIPKQKATKPLYDL
jgi:hypothetical protein